MLTKILVPTDLSDIFNGLCPMAAGCDARLRSLLILHIAKPFNGREILFR